MLNPKNFVLTLGLIASLCIIACNKSEIKGENIQKNEPSLNNKWTSISNWNPKSSNDNVLYHGVLQDSAITESIIANGLVLVYSKNENTIQNLPFSEKNDASSIDWYYQVEQGNILITAATDNKSNFINNKNFTYLVFPAAYFVSSGKTKNDLLQLPYSDALKLLN